MKGVTTERCGFFQTVVIPQNAAVPAVGNAFDIRSAEAAILQTPSALDTNTKIAFKTSNSPNGPWVDVRNASNTLVEITVDIAASHWYEVPEIAMRGMYLIPWTEFTSGTDVVQAGGNRTFNMMSRS